MQFASVVAIAYQCLGIIGCSVPKLVVDDMVLVQETFDAIPEVIFQFYGLAAVFQTLAEC